jgi:hypothetical protein
MHQSRGKDLPCDQKIVKYKKHIPYLSDYKKSSDIRRLFHTIFRQTLDTVIQRKGTSFPIHPQ